MTSTERPAGPTPVKFSRLATRGVLLGLTGPQLAVIGAAAAVLLVALYLGGNAPVYALPVIVVLAALGWSRIAGKPVVAWAPIAGQFARRVVTGQNVYHRRITRQRPYGTLALPGDAASLRLWTDTTTGAAMIHDPHAATLTAVIPVTHPAFTLLDPADQDRRVAGWGRVLATACRSGRLAAVQVSERTTHGTGPGLADWWATHGTPTDGWASRTYADLIDRAGRAGERHTSTVSVALDMKAAARSIRAAGGGMRGASAVLRQETDAITTALHAADLPPDGPLTPGDLALVLRGAYDPAAATALERHGDLGRDLATAGPVSVTEQWDHLRSDSAYHCVLWISQWPRSYIHPGFLAPLIHTTGVRRTLTVLFTPVRGDAAARDIRKKKTEYISDAAQRAKAGRVEDAAQTAEYTDVLQQEADLTAGHGALRTTGLITVSAPDLDRLEQAVAALEQAAIQASCETRRLWGQQAQAFATSALPICRTP